MSVLSIVPVLRTICLTTIFGQIVNALVPIHLPYQAVIVICGVLAHLCSGSIVSNRNIASIEDCPVNHYAGDIVAGWVRFSHQILNIVKLWCHTEALDSRILS